MLSEIIVDIFVVLFFFIGFILEFFNWGSMVYWCVFSNLEVYAETLIYLGFGVGVFLLDGSDFNKYFLGFFREELEIRIRFILWYL